MKLYTIYSADVADFLRALPDNSIDLAIADPPYNMNKGKWDTFVSEEAYFVFMVEWINLLIPKLKDNASLYLFNNAYNSAILVNLLKDKNIVFRNWITWYKKDGFSATKRRYVNTQETILFYTRSSDYIFNCDEIRIPYASTSRILSASQKGIIKNGKRWFPNEKGKLCGDVWEIISQRHKSKVNGKIQKTIHPTIKPIEMIERIIKASSNENDVVLDLFSGTGTTAITAKRLNRSFIGCENNDMYIEHIRSLGIETSEL